MADKEVEGCPCYCCVVGFTIILASVVIIIGSLIPFGAIIFLHNHCDQGNNESVKNCLAPFCDGLCESKYYDKHIFDSCNCTEYVIECLTNDDLSDCTGLEDAEIGFVIFCRNVFMKLLWMIVICFCLELLFAPFNCYVNRAKGSVSDVTDGDNVNVTERQRDNDPEIAGIELQNQ
jgi:hypothetical protein